MNTVFMSASSNIPTSPVPDPVRQGAGLRPCRIMGQWDRRQFVMHVAGQVEADGSQRCLRCYIPIRDRWGNWFPYSDQPMPTVEQSEIDQAGMPNEAKQ